MLIDRIRDFLAQDDWAPREIEGETALEVHYQGDHGRFACQATTLEDDGVFVFHSALDLEVDADRRAVLAEFLHRANFGLYLGNFELDLDGTAVRFKTGIDVEGSALDTALIRNVIYANVLTMDRHLPGLAAIRNTSIGARDALALVEDLGASD